MSGEFIDTNIFIYLFDETDERKRNIAEQLIQSALETRSACISHQVVQETLNVVTRKLPFPMSTENAQRFLEKILAPLWRIMPSPVLYRRGLELQSRYDFSFYYCRSPRSRLHAFIHRRLTTRPANRRIGD